MQKFTYKKRTELLKKLIATQNKYNIIVSHNNEDQQHSTADEILLIEKQYIWKYRVNEKSHKSGEAK